MILQGDWIDRLKTLPDESVQCCVTSPPYWGLRDYGVSGQLGLEKTPEEYVEKIVAGFREVKRVLKDDGVLWVNLGDTYSAHKDCKSVSDSLRVGGRSESANVIEKGLSNSRNSKMLKQQGYKNKDIIGIPWRVAFALQADGWYLRQDIIWAKPNPMPESVTDRCTKSHEYIFLLTKSARYFYDNESVKEKSIDKESLTGCRERNAGQINGVDPDNYKFHGSVGEDGKSRAGQVYENRNRRSVWSITTKPYKEAHFATFPQEIPRLCISAGSKKGDTVLDPFNGAGTTGLVAAMLDREYIGIELNPEYIRISEERIGRYTQQQKINFSEAI